MIGKLHLYYETGVITFETSILLYDMELTRSIIHWNMCHAVNQPDFFTPLLHRVIENEEEPVLVLIDYYNQ